MLQKDDVFLISCDPYLVVVHECRSYPFHMPLSVHLQSYLGNLLVVHCMTLRQMGMGLKKDELSTWEEPREGISFTKGMMCVNHEHSYWLF